MRALLLCIAAFVLHLANGLHAASPPIRQLEIEGVINPMTERYLKRELESAQRDGAQLVILRLDTPGGLESSMRAMVREILASPVPVVVHVAPAGARAASAGMFVTLAASVAAMAPGTNIGAAHPVAIGPPPGAREDDKARPADAGMSKVVEDAAALARSTATLRGRNASWAEKAVRQSVSVTAEEAIQENVIDLLASDTPGLLRALEGRRIETPAGELTLRIVGAPLERRTMNLAERIMHAVTDPNVSYLLMTIGFIGILAELYSPGLGLPGILGATALVLGFAGLGSLPVSLAGLLLMALAIGLFIVELLTPGIGIAAAGGIIAFVLGSLLLYTPLGPTSPSMPRVRVSPWLVASVAAGVTLFFLVILRAVVRSRRLPVTTGIQGLIGKEGQAVTPVDPSGTVRIGGETWSAELSREDPKAEPAPIVRGERVVVTGVDGVTLRVKRSSRAA